MRTSLPAGSALAVDREHFSKQVQKRLESFDNINVIREELTEIDPNIPTIIATGPLTSDGLSQSIAKLVDEDALYFYDAVAPIVDKDSINFDIAYRKSRYDKGDGKITSTVR